MADSATLSKQEFYELPEGWKWLKLGDVLKEDRQMIDPQECPMREFLLITMDCVESGTGKLLKIIKCCGREIKSAKYKFNASHILYGKLRPYLNKVYVPQEEGICTTEFIPFIVTKKAIREYVAFYLRKKEVVDFAMRNITGTRQPRVIINAFLECPIPLPPLEEQRRIVARIEELLSRVEEAKRLRKQAREETEKIMQAALHKVFSRAEEKGWDWKKLGDVCEIFSGSAAPQEKKYFENGRYPFVRVQDLGRYGKTMNLVSIKDFVNDLAVEDLKLVKAPRGSILFPKSGAAILTNSRAILGVDAFIVSHLAAIKAPNPVTSRFIFFWLCEVDMRDYLENPSYPSLKLSRIKQIPIPFPPIEEQKRIVSCLERLFNKVEEVKKLQQQSEKEIEKMAPVILDQAFSGKL
jgi:type I restriction enzyme S subunit